MNIDEIKKAIEKNSNYWEKRALENKLNILENEEDYLKRISDIYDKANKDIDDKLAAVYTRYAKENGMTLDEAYKQLPKAVETQYKKDVIDYVNKAKSGDERWKQYLLNQSLMHKHSVLDQLRTEYRNVIYNIDIEETGGKFLEKIFTNANYYAQYQDNNEAFARVDQNKVQALLQENWSGGGNFSQLIWKNKEQLVEALDDIVVRGFATGQNYDKMSEELAKRMNTSKSNAKRLIMTESARMDNEGLLAHYKETEVEKLIFVATLDMKTSEICRAMDGQIIPIEDAQIGLNVPPLHPYCRSVISPYYEDNIPEDRIYRDTETGKSTKGNYRTYKEYLEEELGDKEQAEALASKRNDLQTLIKALSVVPVNNVAKQSNGAIDINPSEDLLKRNQDSYDDFKERHIDEFTEEMEDQIEKDLKDILDENDMATRVSMENLDKILEDGRIKSQFETGKSSTTINADIRKEIEQTLFGYNLDLQDSLRPIYGYLTNFKNGFDGSSVNGSIMYGNVAIKLKKSNLSNRTTFTFGDSLDGTRWDVKVPSLFTNPSKISISANRSLTDNYGKFTGKLSKDLKDITENIPYVELQFHGGVSIKDIEKVYIYKSFDTWRGKQSLNIDDKVLKKITDKLDKLKIDYEVIE